MANKQIVLFSGGLDSTVMLWHVLNQNAYVAVQPITFQYGSRHNEMEMLSGQQVIEAARKAFPMNEILDQLVIEIPSHVFAGGGSSLMGDVEVPDEVYETDGPSNTEVPFRNGTMLSIAAAHAMKWHEENEPVVMMHIAIHASDGEDWAYPDCRPEFMVPMNHAITNGSYHRVSLDYPFIKMTKAELVAHGHSIGAAMELSYSCYKGEQVHCGVCPTCRERKLAFQSAGIEDPTPYLE